MSPPAPTTLSRTSGYTLVHQRTRESKEKRAFGSLCSYNLYPSIKFIATISLCCMVAVVSFSMGRHYGPKPQSTMECKFNHIVVSRDFSDCAESPVESSSYIFRYNRTFAEASKQADQAWRDIFPPPNGYFSHPTIATQRSTLSVYHQLHCLVCTTCQIS